MSIGTAFHERTAPLNRKLQWREWAGYFAASVYADHHDIEYNAIREAVALIDVTPLYKYRVSGPDAERLVDRVITRDATKLTPGRVYYTPWCDEHGRVVDDGTVARLDDGSFRWTAADPQSRWFHQNAFGLDVRIDDVSESVAIVRAPASRAPTAPPPAPAPRPPARRRRTAPPRPAGRREQPDQASSRGRRLQFSVAQVRWGRAFPVRRCRQVRLRARHHSVPVATKPCGPWVSATPG